MIYATGFEVGTNFTRRIRSEIHGRRGKTLSETWAQGIATPHGIMTRKFPDCFIVSVAQAGATVKFSHMLNEHAKHIAYIIGEAKRHRVRTLEASEAAQAAWVAEVIKWEAAEVS